MSSKEPPITEATDIIAEATEEWRRQQSAGMTLGTALGPSPEFITTYSITRGMRQQADRIDELERRLEQLERDTE